MKKNDTKASGLTVLAFLLVLLVSTLLIGFFSPFLNIDSVDHSSYSICSFLV